MTCATFRLLHRLELNDAQFETFAYFTRLVLSFPSLRHLELDNITCGDRHSPSYRMPTRKQLQLHSLAMDNLSLRFSERVAQWVMDANAIESLAEIHWSDSPITSALRSLLVATASSLRVFQLSFSCLTPGIHLEWSD